MDDRTQLPSNGMRECGPRTIRGIFKICEGMKEGVSIEQCMANASMVSQGQEQYEPQLIRRFAASLISTHAPAMVSVSVTFRQRNSITIAGKDLIKRKRKRNRGQI